MIDQFFIDARFSLAMQIMAYGSLLVSIALLLRRSRKSFFFSGLFLATVDPRFGLDLGVVNPSILGLYLWAILGLTYFGFANHRRKIQLLPFVVANRLGFVLVVMLVLLLVSLLYNFGITAKSFALIFFPYFALLPFGAALAYGDSGAREAKFSFLRGLQVGYVIYVLLTRIFAPGEVTGALGDISVNATIVGIMCSYGLLITLFLMRWGANHKLRIVDLAFLAFFAISALQTLSRGPLIAIAAALPILLLTFNGVRLRRGRGTALLAALCIAGIVALIVGSVNEVLERRNIQLGLDWREQLISSRYAYILQVVDFDSIPLSSLMIGHGLGASEQIARSLGVYRIEVFWFEAAYDIGIPLTLALFIALARNAWAMATNKSLDIGGFGSLYLSLFFFTLFLSPSSFGWFLQGNVGFVYVTILMMACTHTNKTRSHETPAIARSVWSGPNKGAADVRHCR